ncbi:MAG: OmpH family outer membrane protein [Oceanihabitans sp.]
MKIKVLFLLAVTCLLTFTTQAQRGVRIGYIDTEYILENVPEYQEATSQLEGKVQKWKTEIETKLSGIEQKRKDLSNEKALLTNELIKEREEDISFEELEILDYQQKRFGPNGDLMIQKRQLIQPIQDQIFAAVQDIASKKKYDFVFDKSADVVMLYSAERFDMSEQIIRAIKRTSKREQATSRKGRKEAKEEEVVPEVNKGLDARQKALEEKKAARAAQVEQRRKEILEARNAKKEAAQKRRDSIISARQKAREDKLKERSNNTNSEVEPNEEENKKTGAEGEKVKSKEDILEERRQKKLADREARKKELEARKKRIIEERKKAKEEREKNNANEEDGDNN